MSWRRREFVCWRHRYLESHFWLEFKFLTWTAFSRPFHIQPSAVWNQYTHVLFSPLISFSAELFPTVVRPAAFRNAVLPNYTFFLWQYCCLTVIFLLVDWKKWIKWDFPLGSWMVERQRNQARSMNIQLFIKYAHTQTLIPTRSPNPKCVVSSHSQKCCLCVVLNMNSLAVFWCGYSACGLLSVCMCVASKLSKILPACWLYLQ